MLVISLYVSQIINDLMHFKGSHKHEFDSRWKSFTLVKKSMENRVSYCPLHIGWKMVFILDTATFFMR